MGNEGMKEVFKATIPYPPSVNTYWRFVTNHFKAPRVLLSEKGRAYKAMVAMHINRPTVPLKGELFMSIVCYPPDRRRRDMDNVLKGCFDALQYAGIYEDDSQIVAFNFRKAEMIKGGQLDIEISPLDIELRKIIKDN